MIALHPKPQATFACPYCDTNLSVTGWYIPGMRNLAELCCENCAREFYGDLPAGHGLYYPVLLERNTGVVHDIQGVSWFADLLKNSYRDRSHTPIGFQVETLRPLKHAVLLNCLDTFYGHSMLKLLNAQYYLDHCPEVDLIVMAPKFLRWMVPAGVAAIWTVDLPLRRGAEWNDWLATEIKRQIQDLETCGLSVAFSHPHPSDFDIARFTGVAPFENNDWAAKMKRPTVTYIWREDRLWQPPVESSRRAGFVRSFSQRLDAAPTEIELQRRQVEKLAQALRSAIPNVDFAVAGVGKPGGFDSTISDLRTTQIDESVERAWCARYAESALVCGVHGSGMLLPSAHAGAVVDLMPDDRWGNIGQDLLSNFRDVTEGMFRFLFLPISTTPALVAETIASMLREFPFIQLNFTRPWNDHKLVEKDPRFIFKRFADIRNDLK